MRAFSSFPLRRQLVLAICLLLVPVIVAVVWSGWMTYRERAGELADQAEVVARTIAAFVNRDVAELDALTSRLSMAPPVRAMDPVGTRALLARAIMGRSTVLRMELTSLAGDVVAATDGDVVFDESVPWASRVTARGERVLMPLLSPRSRVHSVVIAYPVAADDGRTVGAIGTFVNLRLLQEAFAPVPLVEGSVVTISSTDGRILARSSDADRFVGTVEPGFPRQGSVPPHEALDLDGVRRIHAEAGADAGPWVVSVGLPTSLAMDRAMSLWSRSAAILGLGVIGWLIVALVMSHRLSDAVSHLDATAQRIAAGDFGSMPHTREFSREFADLQRAFESMLATFNSTRERLDRQMAEERRMRTELESLQGQMIRQERLAAVGQLVSGVAHEINNPLQSVSGFAELLQMNQPDLPAQVKADLRVIVRETARAVAIIRNLTVFARLQPGPAGPLRLAQVMSTVVELRQRRLESENIELRIEDAATQTVTAMLPELQQVVLNFVINAEQAILASRRVPARITMRSYDRGDFVALEVEDTGPGVSADHAARLFEPFFTTKPVGQGTGLGLSISYGIIESLGGRIGYRPAPVSGAVFYFELPAVSSRAAAASPNPAA